MGFRRIALWLSVAGVVGLSLVGMPAAAAAEQGTATPTVTVMVKPSPSAANGPLTNCPVVSFHGHSGAYICETQTIRVAWYSGGVLVAVDDVVIGTDYRIYHDAGPGWTWLGGGVASSTLDPSIIGLYIVNGNTIGVFGTDSQFYCNSTTSPGAWAGWHVC